MYIISNGNVNKQRHINQIDMLNLINLMRIHIKMYNLDK